MDLVKSDNKSDADLKNKQLKVLQETIRNLHKKLFELNAREKETDAKVATLEQQLKEANVKELLLKTKLATGLRATVARDDIDEQLEHELANCGRDPVHARLIALLSAYLLIHPHGAPFDTLHRYLEQFVPGLKQKLLWDTLDAYPSLFQNVAVTETTADAMLQSRWTCSALKK